MRKITRASRHLIEGVAAFYGPDTGNVALYNQRVLTKNTALHGQQDEVGKQAHASHFPGSDPCLLTFLH